MATVKKTSTTKQTKTAIILSIVLAVLLFLGAVGFTIGTWDYMVKGETISLSDRLADGTFPQLNDHVNYTVHAVLGKYAETKHTWGFIPMGREYHYIILLEDNSVVSLTAKGSLCDELDKNQELTIAYLQSQGTTEMPQTIEVTGTIHNMDPKIKQYYKETLSSIGATGEVDVHEYTLDTTDTRFSNFCIVLMLLGGSIIFIILAIVSRKRMKKLKDIQSIAREDAMDPSLNPFLAGNQAASANPYTAGAAPQTPVTPAAPTYDGQTPAAPTYDAQTPVAPTYDAQTPVAPAYDGQTPIAPAYDGQTPVAPAYDGQTPVAPAYDGQTPVAPAYDGQTPVAPAYDGQTPAAPTYDLQAPAAPAYDGQTPVAPAYDAQAPAAPTYDAQTYDASSYTAPTYDSAVPSMDIPDSYPDVSATSYQDPGPDNQ